jgi:molybdopterin-biosynthesis enzyme MoeA-like protein
VFGEREILARLQALEELVVSGLTDLEAAIDATTTLAGTIATGVSTLIAQGGSGSGTDDATLEVLAQQLDSNNSTLTAVQSQLDAALGTSSSPDSPPADSPPAATPAAEAASPQAHLPG